MPLVPYMVVEGALSPCHPLQDGRMHMVCLRFLWRRSRQRVRCNITEHGQMLAHTLSPNNNSNIPLILFSPERCAMATVAPGRERTDGGRDAIASAIASYDPFDFCWCSPLFCAATVATWQVTKRHRHTWLGPPPPLSPPPPDPTERRSDCRWGLRSPQPPLTHLVRASIHL